MRSFIAALITVLAASASLLGQSQPEPTEHPSRAVSQTENPARVPFENSNDPCRPIWESQPLVHWPLHREDRILKKGLLAPSADDRLAYASILRMPNTGLVRLLPREVYDSQTYHTKKQIDIRGGGAYYYFAELTHEYGYGSDISLDHDILSVGFSGADFGFLANLGEVSPGDIALTDPLITFAAGYRTPRHELEARSEYRRFRRGVSIDGVLYNSRLPVSVGSTYLLRSVVYDRSDVLIAFKVVSKDPDGSVTILWKRLKKYARPQLTPKGC